MYIERKRERENISIIALFTGVESTVAGAGEDLHVSVAGRASAFSVISGHSEASNEGTYIVGEIEGLFFLRVSHAKRKFEPTERLASTHIHTSFQHCQHSLNTFHNSHSGIDEKRPTEKFA